MGGKVKVHLPRVTPVEMRSNKAAHPVLRTTLFFAVIGFVAWFFYSLGAGEFEWPLKEIGWTQHESDSDVKRIRSENNRLVKELARTERAFKVDQESATRVQEMLQEKDLKILKLNEELAFYRSLLAPEKVGAGVQVKDFTLRGSENNGEYYFNVLLIRLGESNRAVKGNVILSVDGKQSGEMRRLDIKSVENENKKSIKYSFKYFQRLYGRFELPDDFSPQKVIIRIKPDDKNAEPVLVSFSWNELITGRS